MMGKEKKIGTGIVNTRNYGKPSRAHRLDGGFRVVYRRFLLHQQPFLRHHFDVADGCPGLAAGWYDGKNMRRALVISRGKREISCMIHVLVVIAFCAPIVLKIVRSKKTKD